MNSPPAVSSRILEHRSLIRKNASLANARSSRSGSFGDK